MNNVDINTKMQQDIDNQLKDKELNFSKIFKPSNSSTISVTGAYLPLEKTNKFIGLNKNLEVIVRNDVHNYYYGVSPKISNVVIRDAISDLEFSNINKLEDFIKEYNLEFMLHEKQKEYLLAISKYILTTMSYHFCITLSFKDIYKEEFDNILEVVRKYNKCVYDNINQKITIIGCPADEVINKLNDGCYKFIYDNINKMLVAKFNNDSCALEKILQDKKECIKFYKTNVFYNGVLLRPTSIEVADKLASNTNVEGYVFKFERTTYGTVCSFDNFNNLNLMRLREEEIKLINKFFSYEDNVVNNFVNKINDFDQSNNNLIYNNKRLEYLNEYLNESYNAHQIVVSANIITSDNYSIYAIRGSNNIDSSSNAKKTLYPGANGNAEFVDDVNIYKYSVNEDLPTIAINDININFGGELSRETYAELKLNVDKNSWDYYSISLNGATKPYEKNVDGNTITYRRMHFSILAYTHVDKEYDEILKIKDDATESYEIEDLLGVKLNVILGNRGYICLIFNYIWGYLSTHIDKIINFVLFVLSVVGIGLIPFLTKFIKDNILSNRHQTIAFIVCFSFIIAIIIWKIVCKIIKLHLKRSINLLKLNPKNDNSNENIKLLNKKINKILENYDYHPATLSLMASNLKYFAFDYQKKSSFYVSIKKFIKWTKRKIMKHKS